MSTRKLIPLPNGDTIPLSNLVSSLKRDNIVIRKTHKSSVMDKFMKYYPKFSTAKLVAGRMDIGNVEKEATTSLLDLLDSKFIKEQLPSIDKASALLWKHINSKQLIVNISDGDFDGITSATIINKMLKELFPEANLLSIINERVNGNGVNQFLTQKLIKYNKTNPVALLLTSDHGSSDQARYEMIKESTDIEILVTDHHTLPNEDVVTSVEAFLNPQYDGTYVSKAWSGATVAYYLIVYTYLKYKTTSEDNLNYIIYMLNYVGATVLADAQDMAIYTNRMFVKQLLVSLNSNSSKHDPFWTRARREINKGYIVGELSLQYGLIPLINSTNRMGEAVTGFRVMTADDDEIEPLFDKMIELNKMRKGYQNKAVESGTKESFNNGQICVKLVSESEGVQGILASRLIDENNYSLTIVFTKNRINDKYVLVGSGRVNEAAKELNGKAILDKVKLNSNYIINHGGHSQAFGVKIEDDLEGFYKELVKASKDVVFISKDAIVVDDYIYSNRALTSVLYGSKDAGPYGQNYPTPKFVSDFRIESYRISLNNGRYLNMKVKLQDDSKLFISTFYNIKKNELEGLESYLKTNKTIRIIYSIHVNSFKGKSKLQLSIRKLIY